MRIDIVTLFPQMIAAMLDDSIIGRARKKGLLQIVPHQLRDYADSKHRKVDDCTFGGGKGMLLMAEPFAKCIDEISEHLSKKPHIIYMSPRGSVLDQQTAKRLANEENLIILCGHYEGIDERLIDEYVDEEISIGDYVLTGGEIPAAVLVDTVSRMIDGVLAGEECFTEESHYNGLLEYPQYTRPEIWRGTGVPEVLMSGHHENIRQWRHEESIKMTKKHRPDLLPEE